MTDTRAEMVEFPVSGQAGQGFLAPPEDAGPFPRVIVVQKWWGPDGHVKDVVRRFAGEGLAAFAPDLYHGSIASEPGEAQKLLMSLDMNRASRKLVKCAERQRPVARAVGADPVSALAPHAGRPRVPPRGSQSHSVLLESRPQEAPCYANH